MAPGPRPLARAPRTELEARVVRVRESADPLGLSGRWPEECHARCVLPGPDVEVGFKFHPLRPRGVESTQQPDQVLRKAALAISPRTINRAWQNARRILAEELGADRVR